MIGANLMDAAHYKQMSGRAGRTGFDSKGDSIMICNPQQMAHVDELVKPFKCELKSALTGSRLMRSLLDVVASGSSPSMYDLAYFLNNTLKSVLCTKDKCVYCEGKLEHNQALFSNIENIDVYNKFIEYLDNFEIVHFRSDIINDECRGCIFEFTKQVIAYLRKFNFLVF